MARLILTYEQKYFVVVRLARRGTPSEVAAAVRVEFGIDLPRQVIAKYNPTTTTGKLLKPEWRDLFYRHRVDFDRELEARARSGAAPAAHP